MAEPTSLRGDLRSPYTDRFWARIDKTGDCWLWTGTLANGYGIYKTNERTISAHRYAYELLVGPIPNGLTLDHLCRVRNCVNPAHMDPCTLRENILRGYGAAAQQARKTHCKWGHPFDEMNTYVQPGASPQRVCRQCQRRRNRERKGQNRYRAALRKKQREARGVDE